MRSVSLERAFGVDFLPVLASTAPGPWQSVLPPLEAGVALLDAGLGHVIGRVGQEFTQGERVAGVALPVRLAVPDIVFEDVAPREAVVPALIKPFYCFVAGGFPPPPRHVPERMGGAIFSLE